jgi:hypothetical protein
MVTHYAICQKDGMPLELFIATLKCIRAKAQLIR